MLALLTALALSASPSSPALTAEEQERFKNHVLQGEKMFAEGEYGAAIWNFKQADAIRVTPEIAYNLARTHERIGELALTAYYYRLYMRRSPGASDALETAEILGELLSKAESEGRGLVEIESPVQGSATIAGRSYAEFPIAVFLPPGEYEVTAKFDSGTVHKRVASRTGRSSSVTVEPVMVPLLNADGSTAGPGTLAVSASGSAAGPSVARISSYALLGAGAVALASGAAFGAMSRGEVSSLQTRKSALTVSEANGIAESANGKGALANVLFVAGGASVVAGSVLFVFTLPEPGGVGGAK